MSTYREIVGKKIKRVSSDPSSGLDGEMWYNSTTGTLRGLAIVEAWSSASPLIAARSSGAGFGISTAAVYAGGQTPPNASATTTYEYNGSGWSSGGALNTGRYELGGITAGTETAGLCFGGNTAPGWNGTTASEEYNGTAWTSGNSMATTVSFLGGSGIQTAAFSAGGRTPSNTNNSQEYDGTNWSNGNNINTTRQALAGMGTQTAGIIAGGEAPGGGTNSTETYDGTNWTAAPNLGTARYRLAGSGSASTACLVFGGRYNPPAADKAQTEAFDGTSWTEKADLATARQQLSGNRGTSSSAIAAGGLPPPASQTTDTEEFTSSTNTITAAAWASGGALGTPRGYNAGSGTQTAAVCFNGYNPGGVQNAVENYNGSAWSEQGAQNTARNQAAGVGLQTASLVFGGQGVPSPAQYAVCETYDGSSFTEVGNLNTARRALGGAGTQTAALGFLGNASGPADTTSSESWNGSAWTATPSANTARTLVLGAFGTSTAAVAVGGNKPPGGAQSNDVEEYNGSSWTSVPNLPYSGNAQGGSGTLTAGIIFGGNDGSALTTTLGYDGTNWSTRPALSTARQGGGPARNGTSELTLFAGGSPYTTATEEFTGETSAANIGTFTTS